MVHVLVGRDACGMSVTKPVIASSSGVYCFAGLVLERGVGFRGSVRGVGLRI